jgi:hypothetical protein
MLLNDIYSARTVKRDERVCSRHLTIFKKFIDNSFDIHQMRELSNALSFLKFSNCLCNFLNFSFRKNLLQSIRRHK